MQKEVPTTYEEIDLSDLLDEEPEIKSDMDANNVLRSIMHRRAETKAWKDHYKAQADAIEAQNKGFEEHQLAKLQRYFATVPHKQTRTQQKYALLDGDLVYKDKATDYDITDESALVEWLKSNGMVEYVVTKETVAWRDLKAMTTVSGSDVLNALTGEVLPGITATEHPDRVFTVSIKRQ